MPKNPNDHHQVLSVTVSVGRKMQLEYYGGRKYEGEDLFASITLKGHNTDMHATEEINELTAAMYTRAQELATGQLKSMVAMVEQGNFLSRTVDTPASRPIEVKSTITSFDKKGAQKRVGDKMPESAKVLNLIRSKLKWKVPYTDGEKICEKYEWDDQKLRTALIGMMELPLDIIAVYRDSPMSIDWIDHSLYDGCNGDIEAFRKVSLEHADVPFDKPKGGE